MKSKIPSIFIVTLVALFGCDRTNAADDDFDTLTKLAEQGDAAAQLNLGLMYKDGRGVQRDDTEAVKWFSKAAEQGKSDALQLVGFMYARGTGVAQDDGEAVKWYRKAAEQDHIVAQFKLGVMYAKGRGAPQDYAMAYAWFNVAAANGFERAKEARDMVLKMAPPSQIETGQSLATDIFDRIQKGKQVAGAE